MICPPGEHLPSSIPNAKGSCVKCGRLIPPPDKRPRNIDLERMLTEQAAIAAGGVGPVPDGGLVALSEARAWPGGVRRNVNWTREGQEEGADWRWYLLQPVIENWDAYLAGDPEACDIVARHMNALMLIIKAWHALRV